MDAKSAVFAAVAVRPRPIHELVEHIHGFSATSIYHAIGALKKEGRAVIQRRQVSIPPTYRAQKMREIYLKAMSYGIDPGRLTKTSVLDVMKALKMPESLTGLAKRCELHVSKVRRIVQFLRDAGLVDVAKKKPLALKLTQHPLAKSISDFVGRHPTMEIPYYGHFPSKRIAAPPEAVEHALFEYGDENIAIGKTGLMFKGKEGEPYIDFAIISEGPPTPENILLKQLLTADGPEFALHTLRMCKLDYDRLLELAKKNDMVNEVGCFLDLVHLYAPKAVQRGTVDKFLPHVSSKKHPFPKEGKIGEEKGFDWVYHYERKWNVEIRFPVDGFASEVRNLW